MAKPPPVHAQVLIALHSAPYTCHVCGLRLLPCRGCPYRDHLTVCFFIQLHVITMSPPSTAHSERLGFQVAAASPSENPDHPAPAFLCSGVCHSLPSSYYSQGSMAQRGSVQRGGRRCQGAAITCPLRKCQWMLSGGWQYGIPHLSLNKYHE